MKIDIITLFPEMFKGPFSESMIKRAQKKDIVSINIHNLRDWTQDKHKTVDDRPFGGGPGMVIMCDPTFNCVEELKDKSEKRKTKTHVIFMTPQGKMFTQQKAKELSKKEHLILLSGHYEGIDQRIRDTLIDEEISIGDYVLTGGELPTMVVVDSIVRLIPGVVERAGAVESESFSGNKNLLDYPQYTRPSEFQGMKVPEILLSGDHQKIEKWREKQVHKLTKKVRPDLLK